MQGLAARAVDETGTGIADAGIILLTAKVPVVAAARLLALVEGPLVAWSSPEPEPDGRAWSLLGWGEAARIEASGPRRFAEIRALAARLFASMRDRPRGTAGSACGSRELESALSPRLFGGISFRTNALLRGSDRPVQAAELSLGASAPPWSAFQDASFTLPRWLYGTSGDVAVLRLAERADRIEESAKKLAAMCGVIEELAMLPAGEDVAPIARTEAHASGAESASGPARAEGVDGSSTSPEAWRAMVLDALERIRAGELQKVVPAAIRRVALARPIDAGAVLLRMRAAYPSCHSFAFQRGSAVFVGASPERLVTLRGLCVEADALAGSAKRGSLEEDESVVRALASSGKDLREHALVVAAIDRALRPLCRTLHVSERPTVRTLRNVHHLWTPIVGDLAAPGHVLDLVELLHPTPAVCGTPRDAAIGWIGSREDVSRGWYAGAVGWFDDAGDGVFSVAIRSGLLMNCDAWLYAGAGIVEGSDPAAEFAETRVKQAPMLAALGVPAL